MQSRDKKHRAIPSIANYQLDAQAIDPFNTILQLACENSCARSAAVNLVDAYRQKTLVSINLGPDQECARADSLCAIAVDQNLPLIISDASNDGRVRNNRFVAENGGIQFYAGFPIQTASGAIIGALCVVDWHSRQLSNTQQSRLAELAVVAGSLLDLHLLNAHETRLGAFMTAQAKALQSALLGKDLGVLLDDLLLAGEAFKQGTRLAVRAFDGHGLRWLSSPSLSPTFLEARRLVEVNGQSSPCGIAAVTRARVCIPDVGASKINDDYKQALLDEGIHSCASVPLFSSDDTLLGVLALYCENTDSDYSTKNELVEMFSSLVSTLIERTYVARNLAQSVRELNEAQEVAQVGSFSIDLQTGARTYSAVTAKIFGTPTTDLSATADEYRRLMHPDDWDRTRQEIATAISSHRRCKTTYRIKRENDGALRWIEAVSDPLFDNDGKPLRLTGNLRDITSQRGVEELLNLNQQAVELSSIGIVIADACAEDNPVVYANASTEAISGYSRADLIGKNCRILQGRFTGQQSLTTIREGISEKREVHAVIKNMHRSGTEYWIDLRILPLKNSFGDVTHFIGFQYDLTDRIRYEQELIHQAGHDSLTGLINRSLLIDRLDQLIRRSDDNQSAAAVVFFDLDKFKLINDSLGHFAGDDLLKQCARRLFAAAPAGSTIARMGGDEFVILLEKPGGAALVKKATDQILNALHLPFDLDGHSIVISSSAGIALFPQHGLTATDLLRHADIAMYRAKSNGRAQSQVFEIVWSTVETQKLTLKEEIAAGIAQNQFCLHYQPKIGVASGALLGFEALVRWNHPRHGLLYPDRFIDAAEEFGLILPLGTWVLQEACRQNRRWRDAGRFSVPIAVNVSASQFKDEQFVAVVQATLHDCKLQASALELEITESVVMESPEQFIGVLTALHRLGVAIAVDDFGTGYSSLSFIKRFPIDVLKIDKSFVRDLSTDPSDAAICQTIIAMAHNLGLTVVAEGVETAEQAFFLLGYGCDVFQGYFYSKPLPPESDFETIIEQVVSVNRKLN